MSQQNERVSWKEYPDPTPVALPAGVGRPESLQDTIRRMVRNELSQHAALQGHETFEEANDFADDSEDELISQYELSQMQDEYPAGVIDEKSDTDTKPGRRDRRRTDSRSELEGEEQDSADSTGKGRDGRPPEDHHDAS